MNITESLVARPEIRDAAVVDLGDGATTVLVARQGFIGGPALRHLVRQEYADQAPDPLQVIVVDDLPRDATGRLDEAAARDAALRSEWVFAWVPPGTDDERALVEILEELLPAVHVSMTDDLAALGGDSLVAAELADAIARRYEVRVGAADLFAVASVREMTGLVFPRENR